MGEIAPLLAAQGLLEINDVYICEASAYADPTFDPTVVPTNLAVQFRVSIKSGVEVFECGLEEAKQRCVRYLVDTGMRLLKPDVEPSAESIARENLLAEVTATFVVRYRLNEADKELTQDQCGAFGENVLFHLWPYWREFLQATASRLRLPAVVLPMRSPRLAASSPEK